VGYLLYALEQLHYARDDDPANDLPPENW